MSVLQAERVGPDERLQKLLTLVFWVFVGTIAFSIAGSLLLKLVPAAARFFGPIYPSLVKAPTWTYMALLPLLPILMYVRSLGPVLMGFFVVWGAFVGGMSELIGTTTGLPFGAYQYTDWLGAKVMGHVPFFIPFSWFAMSILSLDLARRITRRSYERIIAATLFMVLWDVSLDPAMSRAFPFWVYPEGGFYYGMPASNWLGWGLVSFVIVWGYEVIGGGLRVSHAWAPRIYVLNCLFPLAMILLNGLYTAVVIGALATAIPLLAVWGRERQALSRTASPPAV